MIWNDIFESKTTEPPVGKIEMNFFTQASLGPNSETVTNDEHAYHQFGINGGATGVTIKRRKMTAKIAKVKELINTAQKVIAGHVFFKVERVKQIVLRAMPTHHDETPCLKI
jgi:hypothetical protein